MTPNFSFFPRLLVSRTCSSLHRVFCPENRSFVFPLFVLQLLSEIFFHWLRSLTFVRTPSTVNDFLCGISLAVLVLSGEARRQQSLLLPPASTLSALNAWLLTLRSKQRNTIWIVNQTWKARPEIQAKTETDWRSKTVCAIFAKL